METTEPSSTPSAPSATPSPSETPASQSTKRHGAKLNVKRRGEAAEAAFLHKATLLGFSVAKPWGDSNRYDFILDNGRRSWRVQVKSAYARGPHNYCIRASDSARRKYTAHDVDFLIAYVVPEDAWYVIPIDAFGRSATISLTPASPRRKSRFEKYREAWCLVACPHEGACSKEIDITPCPDRGSGEVACLKVEVLNGRPKRTEA